MDMNQIMQQAAKMQEEMQKIQAAIAEREIAGQSGGGLVKIVLTGKGVVRKVDIAAELLKPEEKEMLEDLIAAAFNDTKNKIEDALQDEMGGLASMMGLPADFKIPF